MALRYSVDLGSFSRLRDNFTFKARQKVFDLFMRDCAPSRESRVADFGVSGRQDHPVHHFFEMLYPYTHRLTALGRESESAHWYPERFPGLTYIECDLRSIPLPNCWFDYGICNAVMEHAGTRQSQAELVHEVCRVCRCVMFTTPNKRFPFEVHTLLPLIHWLPDCTYRAILRRIGLGYFAEVENLNLLDADSFLALFPRSRRNRLLKIGPLFLATNLVCISSEVLRCRMSASQS